MSIFLFSSIFKLTSVLHTGTQAEKVFNQDQYFKRTVKFVGEPMSHLESIASSAVCCKKEILEKVQKKRTRLNAYKLLIFLVQVCTDG